MHRHRPSACRCMAAMAVAHSAVLLAILGVSRDNQLAPYLAGQMLGAIAAAAMWGPSSLGTDGLLQEAVAKCLDKLTQVGAMCCRREGGEHAWRRFGGLERCHSMVAEGACECVRAGGPSASRQQRHAG